MLECEECGSTDVQIKMWVDVNTNIPNGNVSDGEIQDNWCKNCEQHTKLIFKNDNKIKTTTRVR